MSIPPLPWRSRCSVRPTRNFFQINGSTKFAVPTCTALAPTIMNSSMSSAVMMPPIPMIGIRTAWRHSYTMRTAMGRMAGPLSPPTMFASFGRRVSMSIAIARKVLTSETASAPASAQARASSPRNTPLMRAILKGWTRLILRSASMTGKT